MAPGIRQPGLGPGCPGRHCQPLDQTAPGKPPGQGSTHHHIAYWTADFTSFLAAGPRGKPWLSNGGGERTGSWTRGRAQKTRPRPPRCGGRDQGRGVATVQRKEHIPPLLWDLKPKQLILIQTNSPDSAQLFKDFRGAGRWQLLAWVSAQRQRRGRWEGARAWPRVWSAWLW